MTATDDANNRFNAAFVRFARERLTAEGLIGRNENDFPPAADNTRANERYTQLYNEKLAEMGRREGARYSEPPPPSPPTGYSAARRVQGTIVDNDLARSIRREHGQAMGNWRDQRDSLREHAHTSAADELTREMNNESRPLRESRRAAIAAAGGPAAGAAPTPGGPGAGATPGAGAPAAGASALPTVSAEARGALTAQGYTAIGPVVRNAGSPAQTAAGVNSSSFFSIARAGETGRTNIHLNDSGQVVAFETGQVGTTAGTYRTVNPPVSVNNHASLLTALNGGTPAAGTTPPTAGRPPAGTAPGTGPRVADTTPGTVPAAAGPGGAPAAGGAAPVGGTPAAGAQPQNPSFGALDSIPQGDPNFTRAAFASVERFTSEALRTPDTPSRFGDVRRNGHFEFEPPANMGGANFRFQTQAIQMEATAIGKMGPPSEAQKRTFANYLTVMEGRASYAARTGTDADRAALEQWRTAATTYAQAHGIAIPEAYTRPFGQQPQPGQQVGANAAGTGTPSRTGAGAGVGAATAVGAGTGTPPGAGTAAGAGTGVATAVGTGTTPGGGSGTAAGAGTGTPPGGPAAGGTWSALGAAVMAGAGIVQPPAAPPRGTPGGGAAGGGAPGGATPTTPASSAIVFTAGDNPFAPTFTGGTRSAQYTVNLASAQDNNVSSIQVTNADGTSRIVDTSTWVNRTLPADPAQQQAFLNQAAQAASGTRGPESMTIVRDPSNSAGFTQLNNYAVDGIPAENNTYTRGGQNLTGVGGYLVVSTGIPGNNSQNPMDETRERTSDIVVGTDGQIMGVTVAGPNNQPKFVTAAEAGIDPNMFQADPASRNSAENLLGIVRSAEAAAAGSPTARTQEQEQGATPPAPATETPTGPTTDTPPAPDSGRAPDPTPPQPMQGEGTTPPAPATETPTAPATEGQGTTPPQPTQGQGATGQTPQPEQTQGQQPSQVPGQGGNPPAAPGQTAVDANGRPLMNNGEERVYNALVQYAETRNRQLAAGREMGLTDANTPNIDPEAFARRAFMQARRANGGEELDAGRAEHLVREIQGKTQERQAQTDQLLGPDGNAQTADGRIATDRMGAPNANGQPTVERVEVAGVGKGMNADKLAEARQIFAQLQQDVGFSFSNATGNPQAQAGGAGKVRTQDRGGVA